VRRLSNWLPPLAWMAVIAWFSTGSWSSQQTEGPLLGLLRLLAPGIGATQFVAIHHFIRKLAHVTVYGILAWLWYRSLTRVGGAPGAAFRTSLAITLGWAALDELHQGVTPGRGASGWDVALDGTGALLALAGSRLGWRRTLDVATSVSLWTAAAGGLAVAGVDLAAGVSPGVLWATVPAAALLLIGRRLIRR
jgi:VanZ family protein